jgi:hypothetical protein
MTNDQPTGETADDLAHVLEDAQRRLENAWGELPVDDRGSAAIAAAIDLAGARIAYQLAVANRMAGGGGLPKSL